MLSGDALTVNELVRIYRARHPAESPSARGKVLRKLAVCRTPGMGGHVLACDHCDHHQIVWNSCLDRHCPSCMGASAKAWVERQEAALLPVPYFHLVFTLPRPVADLALYNKSLLYGTLMRVSAETLLAIAADPKFLGGTAGFVSVLHTWSQTLEHHPHVHIVAPGGVLSPDGWRESKARFFLPVRVLSALFRRRFVDELETLREDGELRFQGRAHHLADDEAWSELIRDLRAQPWVVYAKPPFGGPEQVVRYLARYTHRVAISNRRLLHFDGERVTFRVRPSEATGHADTVTLPLDAFVERFLLHLLPKGFTRIRHYGFLASRVREANLARLRELLAVSPPASPPENVDLPASAEHTTCPVCSVGTLHRTVDVAPLHVPGTNPHFASTGPPAVIQPDAIWGLARPAA